MNLQVENNIELKYSNQNCQNYRKKLAETQIKWENLKHHHQLLTEQAEKNNIYKQYIEVSNIILMYRTAFYTPRIHLIFQRLWDIYQNLLHSVAK